MLHPIRRLAPLLLLASASSYANDDVFCGAFDGRCLPIVSTGNPLVSFVSNGPPVVAAPSLMIFDSTDSVLSGATVQLAANFHPGEDVLAFASIGNIAGSYNLGTGTLSLTGIASPDAYQAALASVIYSDSAIIPQTDVRTLQWTVTNGIVTSASAQSTATANNPSCPTTSPPVPAIIANPGGGEGVEETVALIQTGAMGCDLGTGCALHIPIDGSIANVMDASASHNPGNCGAADSALTYHWDLRFPPSDDGGAYAIFSGATGADTPILHLGVSSLPALPGADVMYRAILTITNANNPSLFTQALFRFQYDSSECLFQVPYTNNCF
jgi:hypothetical protein